MSDIVEHVCPPEGKVAIVTAGVPLIQIHKADMKHKITYFGTKDSISEFQQKLSKDKERYIRNTDFIIEMMSAIPKVEIKGK